ncbi:tRNA (adenine37-N(6))-methyltransferase TrmN6 [hydrothermal vent metagenome]|uniref:tRNA (Adenine37-N(6))-methyltransferase TrmN6 n=1 Tax=hydrothermal vent metagenome TaxID=652676 RepID=A0A1W1BLM9_9ZZZZ
MRLYQPESGYCYNSDSIFLYDFITRLNPKGDMLDVGAGCGVVGLLVARDFPKIKLEAVEKQSEFVAYAKKNAKENGIEYQIYHQDFLELSETKRYDYIVSNPPFYHDGVQKSTNEMLFYARYNINLPIEHFFKKVHRLLKPGGHFVFCYDASQFGLLCASLDRAKMRAVEVRFVHPKREKKASLVLVHARSHSKSMMQISPPLFAFDGDEFSKEAADIYKKARTNSIKCKI